MISLRSLMCCGGSTPTDPEPTEPDQDIGIEKQSKSQKREADKFEKAKSTKPKEKAHGKEKVISSVHPARHFEAEIKPKSEAHLQFLKTCAGYDGNLKYGKLHANLDANFFTWLEKLDSAFVRQAYIDAVLLTGEHSSASADNVTLVDESGQATDWTQSDRDTLNKAQRNAQTALGLYHEQRTKKRHLPGLHVPGELKQAYQKAAGGDLKGDYRVYVRSLRFCDQIKTATQHGFSEQTRVAINSIMSHEKDGGKAVVIALTRLQILREKQIARMATI